MRRVIAVEDAVSTIWLILGAASLGVAVLPGLGFVSKHGKLQQHQAAGSSGTGGATSTKTDVDQTQASEGAAGTRTDALWRALTELTVPKAWFVHMYVFGLLVGLHIIAVNTSVVPSEFLFGVGVGVGAGAGHEGGYVSSLLGSCRFRTDSTATLCLALLNVQCLRRLWECYFINDFGASTMHVSGYLVGMLHYLLVPLSLALESGESENASAPASAFTVRLLLTRSPVVCAACVGFFLASWVQYTCHAELAACGKRAGGSSGTTHQNNKQTEKRGLQQKQYSFPEGWAFDLVCCPHYTAEIVLYLCLSVIDQTRPTVALFCWVLCNLCVVAQENMQWYRHRSEFGSAITQREKRTGRRWRKCIPFLW